MATVGGQEYRRPRTQSVVLVWTQWPGIGCHFFSSIVSGPWGGRREWNGAPMPTDTIPRVVYTSVGAPVPPTQWSGTGRHFPQA